MIVVDASALVELFLQTPKGTKVADDLGRQDVAAPELIDVEVLSGLARLVRAGTLDEVAAGAAVRLLHQMPLTRIGHHMLGLRAWDLRERVRVADAFYVACGELLSCAVLTCDARLARAALPGTSILLIS